MLSKNEYPVKAGKPAFIKKILSRSMIVLFLLMGLFFPTSCKKFTNVGPPTTSINSANVFTTDATAAAVLTGIYTNLSAGSTLGGGFTEVSVFGGLSADELTLYSGASNPTLNLYYGNALSSRIAGFELWGTCYNFIFTCNAAIEGLNASNSLTPAVKQQLLGEAMFMRAFFYFYLVNLYGDCPLALSSNYTVNDQLARAPKAQVWQQIISDLKNAQSLLSTNYLDATLLNITADRVRPTKWAATAMLARAYLYTGDWKDAAQQATQVISNSTEFSLSTLNNAFLDASLGNNEAIWQWQPVNYGFNTQDALSFILPPSGPSNNYPVYLSGNLVNSFETGDLRKLDWLDSVSVSGTTYYYPFKYKVNIQGSPVTEYEMVLRLGEQYLIRAEAEAEDPSLGNGINDLNVIRQRAGLPNYTGATGQPLLNAIYHERQVELFTEWGQRWLDLKRTGAVDAVMSIVTPEKGGTWNTNDQLYPLPITDIQKDQNLVQNPGY